MTPRVLEGRTILIVEDDYLVAETLAELLANAGATVIGPVGWLDEAVVIALDLAQAFDTAILDVNLHGERSYPIADALGLRDVRIVFATGYGPAGIDEGYRHHAQCTKPFNRTQLLAALALPTG